MTRPSTLETALSPALDPLDPLAHLATERIASEFSHLDRLNPTQFAQLMNQEDARIAAVVGEAAPAIGKLIEAIVPRMREGGRILYFGAGTSGRLGVLDASECVPTFHSPYGQVLGMIAGGEDAMFRAVEGAEDSEELGAGHLRSVGADWRDIVIGIAASGRTPYVIGALKEGRVRGCLLAAVVAVRNPEMARYAEHVVAVETGPEVLGGSTRLKAGTATKLVLNTISTGSMVGLGKTHGNLMVDMLASNEKLHTRAVRLVSRACKIDLERARVLLDGAGRELKTAIVCHELKIAPEEARRLLQAHGGIIRKVLDARAESGSSSTSNSARDPAAVAAKSARCVAVGIDGGGTSLKMRFQVVGESPSEIVLGPAALPATHAFGGTAFEWIRRIKGWLLAEDLPVEAMAAVVAGTSGGGTPKALETMANYLKEAFPGAFVEVSSDAALVGRAGGDPHGLILVAGTGSLAWWEPTPGTIHRAGGWGVGADEGSGAWLAEEAIRLISRAEDGRGPRTSLREIFLEAAGSPSVRSLFAWRKSASRVVLAALASAILEQASAGDAVAQELRHRAVWELAELVRATVSQGVAGGFPRKAFAAGGLFRNEEFWQEFQKESKRDLLAHLPWVRVEHPVDGALARAVELVGVLSDSARG